MSKMRDRICDVGRGHAPSTLKNAFLGKYLVTKRYFSESGLIEPMTTGDFYGHALLALFPAAAERYPRDLEMLTITLENQTAFLVDMFEENRSRYLRNQGGSNAPR